MIEAKDKMGGAIGPGKGASAIRSLRPIRDPRLRLGQDAAGCLRTPHLTVSALPPMCPASALGLRTASAGGAAGASDAPVSVSDGAGTVAASVGAASAGGEVTVSGAASAGGEATVSGAALPSVGAESAVCPDAPSSAAAGAGAGAAVDAVSSVAPSVLATGSVAMPDGADGSGAAGGTSPEVNVAGALASTISVLCAAAGGAGGSAGRPFSSPVPAAPAAAADGAGVSLAAGAAPTAPAPLVALSDSATDAIRFFNASVCAHGKTDRQRTRAS